MLRSMGFLTALSAFTISTTGCDVPKTAPSTANSAPQGQPSAPSGDDRSQGQVVIEDVGTGAPPRSRYALTLWDPHVGKGDFGPELIVKYRIESTRIGASDYRLVLDTPDDTFHKSFHFMGGSGQGTLHARLPIGVRSLPAGTKVYMQSTGMMGRGAGQQASNVVAIKSTQEEQTAGRGSSARAAESPSALGMGADVDQAWTAMKKEFGDDRVAIVKLTGFKELDVAETLLARANALSEQQEGLKTTVKVKSLFAVLLIAPVDDAQDVAKNLEIGRITEVDSLKRLVVLEADAARFPKNDAGIAGDPTHPEFFRVNFELLQKSTKFDAIPDVGFGGPPLLSDQVQAVQQLASADPEQCRDKELRRKIARAFRELALSEAPMGPDHRSKAVQGLAVWGGKYSVPLLIELLETPTDEFRRDLSVKKAAIAALGDFGDKRAIEPLARALLSTANVFNRLDRGLIAKQLVKHGPVAEDAVLEVVPSNNEGVCRTAIGILAEIGTVKSIRMLRRATRSGNPLVRGDAERAIEAINGRRKSAA